MQAYEEDYEKMARDRMVNTRQLNENQIRKMCEKYMNLPIDEQLVHM